MGVTVFDPESISLTEPARMHLVRRVQQSGSIGLQLGLSEKGCNGFMYELKCLDAEPAGQVCFGDSKDVQIYVNPKDIALLRGTEIDFVTEGLNSTLKFRNPNASALCGCGESFSLRGT